MESFAMEEPGFIPEDFGEWMLSRLSQSSRPDHQHLCAIITELSNSLKEKNLPQTPVAFYGATASSLDHLLSADAAPPSVVVEPHIFILSLVFPRVSAAILKKDGLALRLVRSVLCLSSASSNSLASGLKCLCHLLTNVELLSGKEGPESYSVLLSYVIHSDVKVRRQAHLCLRDILQKTHGTKAMQPASEAIAKLFQKYLDLAAKSEAESSEGPRGAHEVLYILEALNECLALMSKKYMASVVERFNTLLMLRQPFVTKPVMDSLNAICLHPTSELPVDILIEVLCFAAVWFSTEETSADVMTFTSRLLKVGMTRIFALNRDLCVVKLPVVFNGLKDILASEHEEAIHAAMDALKSLIHSCIDEHLIREGVNRIRNPNLDVRKSTPTTIEKLCATVENLLDYKYSAVWDMSFEVVSAMFDKLGEHSSYFMKNTLRNLSDMQHLPDEDFPYRKQLHVCVGSALGALGPETFLSILHLNLEANDLSEVNVWLFPILKQYTVGGQLSFFTETILGMVEMMSQKAQKLKLQGRPTASRSVEALIYALWSLLPSFCNYPVDTAESFKDLQQILCRVLQEQSDIRGIICASLHILVQQNKEITEGREVSVDDVFPATQRAIARYTPQYAANNLKVMQLHAPSLLSILSRIFHESGKDDGGSLQSAIGDLASIAEKKVVTNLLLRTLKELLKVTRDATKAESSVNQMETYDASKRSPSVLRARLLDLSVSLLPGLDANEVDAVFSAIKPALQDGEGLVQKKAYKVLSIILKNSDGFLSSHLEEVLALMIEVLPSCHFSAKHHRLDCLYFLIARASRTDNSEQKRHKIVCSFLTEVILALKEANKKTRNRAYDVLVQIGHVYGDEENGGNSENLLQFFNMVAGGMAGDTPHMISAAVKGLARLAYEFSELVCSAYNLLPSTFLLLERKNREIIKANLGLLKVLVAKSPVEGLQAHLKSMVEGLLKWQDETKNHFKAKVKLLLEMLVSKCGLEAVKSVMPEEHMKLLTNIRKIKERKGKKLAASSDESKSHFSKATTSRGSRWNHTKIFSDFGDDDEDSDAEYMGVKSRRSLQKSKALSLRSKRNHHKSLPEDLLDQLEDEPLDLLDRSKTRSALRSSELRKRKSDSDEEPEFDSEGRLIIREGDKPRKKALSDPDSDARSEAGSHFSAGSSRKIQKRRKTSESGYAYTGSEYASKKASGDVKRKDKLEPYAYWPLDRKMMSRRPEQRAAAIRGMSSVVKLTKKLEGKSAAAALATSKFAKFKRVQKKSTGKKKANKK
ncbi:PREDICTED: RRP12-like protein [Tarenaya hassleriana]|uniref:RRP12-like protein n=1 Tax=Tarenaya hassleriana TaxID=28532 RepID=UPI00053CA74B|nr:PREDICTED: RRP12-like protein [Tarenaya hassleriana]